MLFGSIHDRLIRVKVSIGLDTTPKMWQVDLIFDLDYAFGNWPKQWGELF